MHNDPHLVRWEQRHAESEGIGEPAQVLLLNSHLLTPGTRALDLACGRGASAILLARLGLLVSAWDFSTQAIQRLMKESSEEGLSISCEVRDVVANPPEPSSFDVILVSYFLDRTLFSAIKEALKPGGLLLYETFTRYALGDRGPSNPDWRLAQNELLALCSDMQVHYYREDGGLGEARDVAMIAASRHKQGD